MKTLHLAHHRLLVYDPCQLNFGSNLQKSNSFVIFDYFVGNQDCKSLVKEC
jgi:hypothetical protein